MAITGSGPGPEVLSAESLIGDKVVNPQGEDLGKIEEIMIDMGSGQVNYAVLSFGGIFGIGDKLFAIPWKLLRLDPDNKRFICDIPKDKLERAPGFDKNNWPRMSDRDWGREVHTYYGQDPYWEKGTGLGGQKETGREYH
jgi:sporulation protein YlmC with PRC-barrel domain